MKRYTKEIQDEIKRQKNEIRYICGIYLLTSGFHIWATFKELSDAEIYANQYRCEILIEEDNE